MNFKSTDVNDDQIFANDSEKVYYDEFKDKCEENYFKPSEEYLGSPDSSITLHRFEVKPVKPEIHQLTSYQTRIPSTDNKYSFIPEISTGIKTHYEKLCKEDNNKWFMDSDRNGDEDEEKQEQTTYELENAVGRNIFEIFLSFLEFNVYVLFFVTSQEAIQDLLINTGGRVDLAVEYLQRLEGVQPYLNNAVGRKAYIQVKIFLKYSFYFSNLMYSIFSG